MKSELGLALALAGALALPAPRVSAESPLPTSIVKTQDNKSPAQELRGVQPEFQAIQQLLRQAERQADKKGTALSQELNLNQLVTHLNTIAAAQFKHDVAIDDQTVRRNLIYGITSSHEPVSLPVTLDNCRTPNIEQASLAGERAIFVLNYKGTEIRHSLTELTGPDLTRPGVTMSYTDTGTVIGRRGGILSGRFTQTLRSSIGVEPSQVYTGTESYPFARSNTTTNC